MAFSSSSATIALMILVTAFSLYPVLVPSNLGYEFSLTIHNAASTTGTLLSMALVGAVGLPIMLVYTYAVYRSFKGPVRLLE